MMCIKKAAPPRNGEAASQTNYLYSNIEPQKLQDKYIGGVL